MTGGGDLAAALEWPPTAARPRFDLATGALVGSRCDACGAAAWPARAVCHRCGSAAVAERAFAGPAQLLSYTEVLVPRPGLDAPYLLGQVRLCDGPIVFGRLVGLGEPIAVPLAVRAHVGRGADGAPQYWFEPG